MVGSRVVVVIVCVCNGGERNQGNGNEWMDGPSLTGDG